MTIQSKSYFGCAALTVALLCSGARAAMAQGAAAAAGSTADLPISRVALYTSGVGYFERSGAVDGDASETLLFPVDQINDILKSLVLLDTGGGSIEPVTYAAQDPLEKELQAFSLDLSDTPDRATILNRLRGAQVQVTTKGPTESQAVTGTVLAVETKSIQLPNGGGTTQSQMLDLMTDAGVTSVDLDSVQSVKFLDPKLDSEIRSALAAIAQGRDKNKRAVTLHFDGHGRRTVEIGYLAATPLWQTSYRLVLGDKPVMQGWAMVQNTSQDDWTNVHLSLVSGRPVSFIQDLYTPIYVPRTTIQAQVAEAPAPQTYLGNGNSLALDMPVAKSAPAAPDVAGFALRAGTVEQKPASQPNVLYNFPATVNSDALSRSIATNGATLGASLFSYDIDIPVSVPRQQSAMIPFLATSVQARRVSIYNNTVLDAHPMSGARMVNTSKLHLMGGPITVFDQQAAGGTGYVGDAIIEDTEPGQSRLFSFAVDLGVDCQTAPGDDQGLSRTFVIDHGVLYSDVKTASSTVYTFKNSTADARLIVLEHMIPTDGGNYKLVEPVKADEKLSDRYRFDVPVAAKENKSVTVKLERTITETYGLADSDPGTLLIYSRRGEISPEMRDALREVVSRRRAVADTQQSIANVQAQIDAIGAGQDRIRKNMNALDKSSALYKRYVSELDSQETALQQLNSKHDSLQSQLTNQQADLSNYIANLTVK